MGILGSRWDRRESERGNGVMVKEEREALQPSALEASRTLSAFGPAGLDPKCRRYLATVHSSPSFKKSSRVHRFAL